MKVAVLYIALGRYVVFWEMFRKSAEKYLLNGVSKRYFVFTDSDEIKAENDVIVIKVTPVKWPFSTMMRFSFFCGAREKLEGFDYMLFFNANMQFVRPVGNEILPGPEHNGLVAGLHPAFFNKPADEFTYERNPESEAYIAFGTGSNYYQGCLNGGSAGAFMKMAEKLDAAVKKDMDKNIIAVWHDESLLNKYLLDKNPAVLHPGYLFPEGWKIKKYSGEIRILQVDKENPVFGGLKWLRGETDIKMTVFQAVIKNPVKIVKNIIRVRKWWKGIS